MKRPLAYADGLGTGIAAIGLLVIAFLASASAGFGDSYRAINPDIALPAMTKLVLSPAWRVIVPTALLGGLVAAHVWRPRYLLIALAVVTFGVAAFWYWAAYQPIFAMAGNIR